MLQRLAQFRVALAEFFEQTHVFDGDHRLRGKGFQQRYLLVSERLQFRTTDVDQPDSRALAKQRRDEQGSNTAPHV